MSSDNSILQGLRNSFLNKPMFGLADPATLKYNPLYQAREGAQKVIDNPDAPAALAGVARATQGTIDLPKNVGNAIGGFVEDAVNQPAVQQAGVVLSGGSQADLREVQQRQQEQDALEQLQINIQKQQDLVPALQNVQGLLGAGTSADTGGQSIDLGPAPTGGGVGAPALPAPPPALDFSGVYGALEQAKPEAPDQNELKMQREGAIILGALGGLLTARNPDDIGNMLLTSGFGALSGAANADAAKREANEKFKAALDDYWRGIADVKFKEAQSDRDYAKEVWRVKTDQLLMNYKAAAANRRKDNFRLVQTGDGVYALTERDGRRVLEQINVGSTDTLARMHKNMTQVLGGTEEAEEKANAILSDRLIQQNPNLALPQIALFRMEQNGKFDDFVKLAPEAFSEAGMGMSSMPVNDPAQVKDIATNKRRALAIDMMLQDDAIMLQALQYSGLAGSR